MFKKALNKIKELWTSRQDEKRGKITNKESIIDAFNRKLVFAREDRSRGRLRKSRRRREETMYERLLPSRSSSPPTRSPSPSTRVSRCQSFAETTDMSDLPDDLVEEILSRIPATSLKRLRSVCKRWNTLFKEPGFSEKHFRNAPKQSRVLMLKNFCLLPTSVNLNVVTPSIEFKYALSLYSVFIKEVFHCDGLLLLVTHDNRPLVWNPYLGETRWIQHKNGYDRRCRFALGYDNNNQSCRRRSYKTLMYLDCTACSEPLPENWMHRDSEPCRTNNPNGGFEIYEFDSNSWRVVIPPNCVRIGLRYRGVTLKGNTYWISVDENGHNCLLSFDFTRERFRRSCLPPSSDYCMALSVVREEQLSMLSFEYKLEMWVTKKIDTGAELSWSKSFSVDLYRTSPIPVYICFHQSFSRRGEESGLVL